MGLSRSGGVGVGGCLQCVQNELLA